MISYALLMSFLFGFDVTCGINAECRTLLQQHTAKGTWGYVNYKDFKGTTVTDPPLPRVSPFASNAEEEINKQINRELFASYTYLSMATHFDRDDISLPGFHKFFKEASEEEREHATKLMEYQNKRGGRVRLHGIMKPCNDQWGNGLEAMQDALALEKDVYQALLDLHKIASLNEDPQLQDFLESNYLGEQVDSIKQLSNYVNTLKRMANAGNYALGEYQFDKITLGGGDVKS